MQHQAHFLETASLIGARLCRDAIWDGSRCNWLGSSMELLFNNWALAERSFGPDLYGGTSGIALFLARLYQIVQEPFYQKTASGAMQQALSRLEDVQPEFSGGFYSGLPGIAYSAICLGNLFDRQDWIHKGLQILKTEASKALNPPSLDVSTGVAGTIPTLLVLYKQYPEDFLLQTAIQLGEHLLATARKSNLGWSWQTLQKQETQQPDLTGFSHGAAGIAWALLELYRTTHRQPFRVAAEEGFRYEQHWFNPEQENWPDLRQAQNSSRNAANGDGQWGYAIAWCHGAPGIGLSRLRAYEILENDDYLQQAEAALRTTVRMLNQTSQQENYSLCHGVAGNAELLLYADRVLGRPEYRTVAERVGNFGIQQYEQNRIPWPCGVMGGGETPNLMLGLAGIGHFYLRLYDSVTVPSVVIILPEWPE